MQTHTPDRFLRLDAVLEQTGLSRSTLYRRIQQGSFPPQVRISERCVGWRQSAIDEWSRSPLFYEASEH